MTTEQDLNFALDFESLTIGELEQIEDITGLAFSNIDWEHPSTKVMKAMAYIAGKRSDPTFTIEDAANVKLTAFSNAVQQPKEADADPKPLRSANGVA
jgi:hypothetical protein